MIGLQIWKTAPLLTPKLEFIGYFPNHETTMAEFCAYLNSVNLTWQNDQTHPEPELSLRIADKITASFFADKKLHALTSYIK